MGSLTPQQEADVLLKAWQNLRDVPSELRLPLIDLYSEIERLQFRET